MLFCLKAIKTHAQTCKFVSFIFLNKDSVVRRIFFLWGCYQLHAGRDGPWCRASPEKSGRGEIPTLFSFLKFGTFSGPKEGGGGGILNPVTLPAYAPGSLHIESSYFTIFKKSYFSYIYRAHFFATFRCFNYTELTIPSHHTCHNLFNVWHYHISCLYCCLIQNMIKMWMIVKCKL